MGRGKAAEPLKLEKDRGSEVLKRIRKRIDVLARKWSKLDYQLQVHVWNSKKVDSISKKDLATLHASCRAVGIEIRFILKWLATNSFLKGPRWNELEGCGKGEGIDVEQVGCVVCGISESTDENDILLCDRAGCFCAFHMECCDPPVKIDEIGGEDDPWFCRACDCLDKCLDVLRNVLDDPEIFTWEKVFPELANEELPSDMDASKLLLQGGDTSGSDDEDFNPLEDEDDNHQRVNGEGGKLDDDQNCTSKNIIGNYKHDLFFYPDEGMDSNTNVRDGGGQHGRQQHNRDIKGCFGIQHSISEGVEMSERNKGSVEQSVGIESQNNDLQQECTTLFEVETAAADSDKKTKEHEDTDSCSDSSMIVDPLEAAREIDELSDGFSEDDPARHNRRRCRMASSKVDNESETENFMILGVENVGQSVSRVKCGVLQFGKVVDFSKQKWACKFGSSTGEKIVLMDKDELRKALQLWEKEGKMHVLERSSDSGANSDDTSGEETISRDNIILGTRARNPVNYVNLNHILFGPEYIPGVDDGDDFVHDSLDLSGYVERDEEAEHNAGDEDGTGGKEERYDEQHAPLLPQASNISLSGYSGEEVVELCYQSVEVFMAVRDKVLLRDSSPSEYSQSWVDLSFKYRKLMRECANAVRRRADDIAAGGFEADLEVEAVVATLDFLGKVWHLVEIVHIDAGPLVALAIAHWLREHFCGRALSLRLSEGEHRLAYESKLALGEDMDLYQCSWYKELLIELVMWGRLRRAVGAIRIRPDYVEGGPSNPPYVTCELLKEFPPLSFGGTKGARREFENDFLRWHRRCESCEPVIVDDESLHQIMGVLLGKEDVIFIESNGSWPSMMSAHLLYVCPTATIRDIRLLANKCISAGDSLRAPQDSSAAAQAKVDRMVLDIMSGEPGEAVNLLARAGDDISAAGALAHFVHLLHSCGVLSEDMIPMPSSEDSGDPALPERLLVNFSEKLFSIPRGRDIAVQYLSSCPKAGEEALRALIQRVQPQSEKETELLVMWCRRGGLEEEADTLCRTRAHYWMLRGTSNYGAVVYWLTRARDGPFLGKVCLKLSNALMDVVESAFWERRKKWCPAEKTDSVMSSFAKTKTLGSLSLHQVASKILNDIDGVSHAIPDQSVLELSTELEFLLGYKRLVEALDFSAFSCVALNGDSREVATRLEQLLADVRTTPMRAWPHLMKLAHLLLKVDGSALNSKQLLTILNRLHELELSYKCEDFSLRDDSTDNTIGPGKKGGEQGGGDKWYSEVKSTLASGLTAALMRENKLRKTSVVPSKNTSLETTSAFQLLVGSLE